MSSGTGGAISSGSGGTGGSAGGISCEGYNADDYADAPVTFAVEGQRAIMSGYVDGSTPNRVDALLADHPNVTMIVMPYVPGSDDDFSNLSAARKIRSAGLATCVPSTGLVASGGVDFFVAGVNRSAADGAQVGVHSWATGDGTQGKDVPKDSSEHQLYLSYYDEMGISQDFYWYTLEAAPADDIYWMTQIEIKTYKLAPNTP